LSHRWSGGRAVTLERTATAHVEPVGCRRAGTIRPDPAEMHVVYCPRCGRGMGETKLLPGTLNRYRCKRCGDWTSLVGVAVRVEAAEALPGASLTPDVSQMHVVFCVSCSRTMGETSLVPGVLNRYRCRSCGEWMWMVGVLEGGLGGEAGRTRM
jgi:transposase-like protein